MVPLIYGISSISTKDIQHFSHSTDLLLKLFTPHVKNLKMELFTRRVNNLTIQFNTCRVGNSMTYSSTFLLQLRYEYLGVTIVFCFKKITLMLVPGTREKLPNKPGASRPCNATSRRNITIAYCNHQSEIRWKQKCKSLQHHCKILWSI